MPMHIYYYIVSQNGKYILHSDGKMYCAYFHTNIYPLCYTNKALALRHLKKVQKKYSDMALRLDEYVPSAETDT